MSPFDQSTCLLKTYEQMKDLINESAHKIEIAHKTEIAFENF